jgi:hypothetical protein
LILTWLISTFFLLQSVEWWQNYDPDPQTQFNAISPLDTSKDVLPIRHNRCGHRWMVGCWESTVWKSNAYFTVLVWTLLTFCILSVRITVYRSGHRHLFFFYLDCRCCCGVSKHEMPKRKAYCPLSGGFVPCWARASCRRPKTFSYVWHLPCQHYPPVQQKQIFIYYVLLCIYINVAGSTKAFPSLHRTSSQINQHGSLLSRSCCAQLLATTSTSLAEWSVVRSVNRHRPYLHNCILGEMKRRTCLWRNKQQSDESKIKSQWSMVLRNRTRLPARSMAYY